MTRVILADDHAFVREGYKRILAAETGISVVAEASDIASTMQALDSTPAEVLLLDINLKGRSALEVLADIRRLHPRVAVLVVSMHPEEQIAVRAMRAGASGYLNKEAAPEDLVVAVRALARGRKHITPVVAEILAVSLDSTSDRPPHESLSTREYQILEMIAAGKQVSQIAAELNLSVKTVSTYRTRVLEKMEMKTNAELTRYAILSGLAR